MNKLKTLNHIQHEQLDSCFESWIHRFRSDPIDKLKINTLVRYIYRKSQFRLESIKYYKSPCEMVQKINSLQTPFLVHGARRLAGPRRILPSSRRLRPINT